MWHVLCVHRRVLVCVRALCGVNYHVRVRLCACRQRMPAALARTPPDDRSARPVQSVNEDDQPVIQSEDVPMCVD